MKQNETNEQWQRNSDNCNCTDYYGIYVDWAADTAMYCQQSGIISGHVGGNFVPQNAATSAEAAVILQEIQWFSGNKLWCRA